MVLAARSSSCLSHLRGMLSVNYGLRVSRPVQSLGKWSARGRDSEDHRHAPLLNEINHDYSEDLLAGVGTQQFLNIHGCDSTYRLDAFLPFL